MMKRRQCEVDALVSRFLFSVPIACLLLGCVSGLGYQRNLVSFMIEGTVFDEDGRTALQGVQVEFYDAGFSREKAFLHVPDEKLGKSNKYGQVNIAFHYIWWSDEGAPVPMTKEAFHVGLSKVGYRSKLLYYDAEQLEREDGAVSVDFGTVALERAAETAGERQW